MVVLAVSLMSKSGKPLVSRQFVEMTRSRIEGILSAFTKLVGTEQQHTYVETDSIRYVYHPIEDLYLILVTNKQSNILEDIEMLRLLSKIVPEYSKSLDQESICKAAFELVFAFDEVISLGNREILTVLQVKQYCEMESHEEKLHKVVLQSKISETKDIMKRKASEIDKSKTVKGKGDKGGGLMGISSRIQSSFSELSISKYNNGSGSGSGFGSSDSASGFNPEIESFSSKSKDRFLTSVTAPSKGLGMKLGKSKGTNQFLESLKAEGEVIPEDDAQPTSNNKNSQQARALITSSDPVTLIIEEKLIAMMKRDGGVSDIDVQGTLSLQILNQEDGLIQLEVESQEVPGLSFRTHPNISRELFNNRRIIALKDPNRPFPAGQNDVSLVKWRIQGMDETSLPLTLSCWPSVSGTGSETYVNIEYEASEMFDLHNVVISIPLPAIQESPSVRQIDGEWRYDSRNSTLDWSILLIDSSNLSGAMEFVVPTADDTSVFFPITVRFTSPSTFSGVKVNKILPLKDGFPPKFSQTTQIVTDTYQVV